MNKENFDKVVENTKKELAASIAMKNYLESTPTKISESELKKYFNENIDDYSNTQDAFVLNLVSFKSRESAINFRSNALSGGWEYALTEDSKNSTLIESMQNKIFKHSDIQSKRIIRVLEKLFRREISLVVETELNNFVVVQQIDRIKKNSTPKYKYVKDLVNESFVIVKQREQIRHLLDSLATQKKIKIY